MKDNMSFTNFLDSEQPRARRGAAPANLDLPIATNHTPQMQPGAANIMASTNSKIENAKNDLYEKIDVCCAQYGLYGLQVISEAISNSLSQMIYGMNRTSSRPAPRQQTYSMPAESVDESTMYQQPAQPYNRPAGGAAAFADDFMNHISDIFEACDKDVDQRAEAQIKARLLEQKQADMIASQQQAAANQQAEIDLATHADDFELTGEENLHNV